ncbi:MAG: restriction endonuclease subunit S [bacterium]|nr:restriction endonuclease subunit S [bacterium]
MTDIADTFIGLVTTMTKHYTDNGVLLLRNSDIVENGIELKNEVYLEQEFANKYKHKMHKVGDIVTVHTGDVGTSAIVDDKYANSLGFATIVSRIKDNTIPEYVCYYLNSNVNKMNIQHLIKGDRSNLNLKDFNKLVIPIPSLNTQKQIVEQLNKFYLVDKKIRENIIKELEIRRKQFNYYRDILFQGEKDDE